MIAIIKHNDFLPKDNQEKVNQSFFYLLVSFFVYVSFHLSDMMIIYHPFIIKTSSTSKKLSSTFDLNLVTWYQQST